MCELSLLFDKKEGVEEIFLEVVGNCHYEKLWNPLDKRELRDFGSTKVFIANVIYISNTFVFLSSSHHCKERVHVVGSK